jgi:alpha/beta superfamily hydrolase
LDGPTPYGINAGALEQRTVSAAGSIERVTFRSRRGARLVGLWHGGSSDAAVVLCHGMEATKEGIKSVRLATALAEQGIHALRFDFSYVGESEGEFLDLTVSGEVEDLAGAWAFARARVQGPLGIIGSSLGGTVALLFAAAEPSMAALATIAAVADPGRRARVLSVEERARWRADGAYALHGVQLGAAFLDDVERLAVLDRLSTVRCPALLTHGTADRVVPCADADAIAARVAGPCTVRRYDGADHRFSDPAQLDALLADLTTWMVGALGGAQRAERAAS